MANNQGILREKRDLPPAHYTVEIKSFMQLFKPSAGLERFESGIFEAGRYKWRLVFYPNGNKKDGGDGHISLYLAIDKSNAFSDDWSVHVNYKLFVQDHLVANYLAIHDAKGPVRRFDKNKTEWGFGKFLSLATFNEPLNGYLVNDTCVFGAEVFVIETTGKGESISIIKNPPGATQSWKIQNFSKLNESAQWSDTYIIGDRKWRMKLYPIGELKQRGKCVSIYLYLSDFSSIPRQRDVYAEFKLRIVDQLRRVNGFEIKFDYWFGKLESWGRGNFISLKDFYDASKGYVVDDTVTVELQFLSISVVKLD